MQYYFIAGKHAVHIYICKYADLFLILKMHRLGRQSTYYV